MSGVNAETMPIVRTSRIKITSPKYASLVYLHSAVIYDVKDNR